MPSTILFRADASLDIGTGHVMRCLTLADALSERGAKCVFVCRDHSAHLGAIISRRGHALHLLPHGAQSDHRLNHAAWLASSQAEDAEMTVAVAALEQPEWLVVDHYALDLEWETLLRPFTRRLLAIDDLADRMHDCDLLVDQNLGRSAKDYAGLVPAEAKVLAGSAFALLRPEFAQQRGASIGRRGKEPIRNLLIALGGVDKDNFTARTLEALRECPLPSQVEITVVLGATAPWLADITALGQALPWPVEVLTFTNDMAGLMVRADVAIGAAGATTLERCCLGVPAALWVLAENQRDVASAVVHAGAAVLLDPDESQEIWMGRLAEFLKDAGTLAAMSRAASELVDGNGLGRVLPFMGYEQ